MAEENEGSLTAAVFWMLLISLLLFWLPFVGPLIAGIVGGRAAGSVGSALVAVIAPCIIIAVAIFFAGPLLAAIPHRGRRHQRSARRWNSCIDPVQHRSAATRGHHWRNHGLTIALTGV